MINIAVIGVGYLGRHHARVFSELENVRLYAVVDTEPERAEDAASKYNCLAFSTHEEVLDKVDAVSIVTPTTTHYKIALDCLNAEKDIFVEKPFTVSVEEADRLIDLAEKRGRLVQVGHIERYNPAVLKAESLIDSPAFFESERLSPFLGRGTDVDVTLDLMIHDIDIILSLAHSRVRDVRAVGKRVLSDRLDVAKAWIEFENGISALTTAGRLSREKRRTLKVFQNTSYVVVDYQDLRVTRYFKNSDEEIGREVFQAEPEEPLRLELSDFVHTIKNRLKPRVSGEDGREALKVAMMINERIKEQL
ncbi:MAG: gfo/Idh/MocA family oxidoreductase [Nitrospirae bacterium]|nr:MAG: gfo/Idh/MocA family oxidoreductase [Nitrospirota bacterium]